MNKFGGCQAAHVRSLEGHLAGRVAAMALACLLAPGSVAAAKALPEGYLFRPILAGPNEPISYVSFNDVDSDAIDFSGAFVSLGNELPLLRWGDAGSNALQLGVFSTIQSQFNLDTSADNLQNTDFLIGVPLSYRHDAFSARARLFHQSSHLGDELLLSDNAPERENLSFEAVDALLAYEWGNTRLYGGGLAIVADELEDGEGVGDAAYQAGFEYRGGDPLLFGGRPIVGLDVFAADAFDYDPQTKLIAGLGFGERDGTGSKVRVLFQAFEGPVPFGQFFDIDTAFYGVAIDVALD